MADGQLDNKYIVATLGAICEEFASGRQLIASESTSGELEAVSIALEAPAVDPPRDQESKRSWKDRMGRTSDALHRAAASRPEFVDRVAHRVVGEVVPASPEWAAQSARYRVDWWAKKFGSAAAALVAVPSAGGKVAQSGGLLAGISGAAQVLVIAAVATELNVTDTPRQVRLAARIVLDRDIDVDEIAGYLNGPVFQREEAEAFLARGQEMVATLPSFGQMGQAVMLLRRNIKKFTNLAEELDSRPQGGRTARFMKGVPGVGVVGGLLNERAGIKKAADQAVELIVSGSL